MRVAKVIGTIWATRKRQNLEGLKLLIVRPINIFHPEMELEPLVAADTIDAGVGETVLIVAGSSARGAAGGQDIPVDATVVAIVDDMDLSQE